ncbi:MAG: helix-turn-helix domain-containing protein [Hyphomicrobiaceae bacterium]
MENKSLGAEERLAILCEADQGGSVSEVCARHSISRPLFYRWKRRYATSGLRGLSDAPPIARSHPLTLSEATQDHIVALALNQPDASIRKIARLGRPDGEPISTPTVAKVLHAAGLATRHDRWTKLEDLVELGASVTSEQRSFLRAMNPNYKDRDDVPNQPGTTCIAGIINTLPSGSIHTIRIVAVIDSFSCFAFAREYSPYNEEETAERILREAYNYFREHGVSCERYIIQKHRALRELEQYREVQSIQHSGYIERFRSHFRGTLIKWPAQHALEDQLSIWLKIYNSTPLAGFPTFGQRPIDILTKHFV